MAHDAYPEETASRPGRSKLLALFLLGRGHATSAVLLLVGAKLAGTAVVARLFQLVEPPAAGGAACAGLLENISPG
jgi:hypothetical protein